MCLLLWTATTKFKAHNISFFVWWFNIPANNFSHVRTEPSAQGYKLAPVGSDLESNTVVRNLMMYFNIDFINGNNKSRVLKFTD